jgi:hypothetical protein
VRGATLAEVRADLANIKKLVEDLLQIAKSP